MCGLPRCQEATLQPTVLWVLWGLEVLSHSLWVLCPSACITLVLAGTATLAVLD